MNDRKVEKSIPVQSRIDITAIANLDIFMQSNGVIPRSLSGLVSVAIDTLVEYIKFHGQLEEPIETVHEAVRYVEARGLWQKSLKGRGAPKLMSALGFESLREDGESPEEYNRPRFKEIYNRSNRTYVEKVPLPASSERDKLMEYYEQTQVKSDLEAMEEIRSDQPRKMTEEELADKARELEEKEVRAREVNDALGVIPDRSEI